jgi:hypothetical protein
MLWLDYEWHMLAWNKAGKNIVEELSKRLPQ